MTVVATLIDITSKGKTESLGEFEFVAVPTAGDVIPETSMGGTPYLLEVVRVRHFAVPLKQKLNEYDVPAVTVYVRLLGIEHIEVPDSSQ